MLEASDRSAIRIQLKLQNVYLSKKEKVQPIVSVAPFYIHKILKEREFYLFLLQSLLISSRVLPFVSGTQRQTKKAAAMQMMPYKLYANIGLKSYSAGNVEDMI